MNRGRLHPSLPMGLTRATICCLCLLAGSAALAGIAIDGSSSATGSAATLIWPHTQGAGAHPFLVVGVSIRNAGRTVQSITYAGVPLSLVAARNNHDGAVRAELWSLASPPAGTADVVVTLTGGAKTVGGAVSVLGVDPTAPLGTPASAFSTDTGTREPSVTVSSAPGEVVVDVLAMEGSAGWLTPSPGHGNRWSLFYGTSGGDAAGSGGTTAGAASITTSWTAGAGAKWAMVAVPLRPAPTTPNTLYLKGDGVPRASLLGEAPSQTSLPNYTPGRDGFPGLYLSTTPNGWSETDPARHQLWVAPATGMALDGPVSLRFWSATRDFQTGTPGRAEAYLLDCDDLGANCSLIARGIKDRSDWSGGWGSWNPYSIDFGRVSREIPAGRSLAVTLVAAGANDLIFAYDTTTYPSQLTDQASSDIVIDCDFRDWSDAEGTEFDVIDQGGPDDWTNPVRLDLTRFAVSSNLVDSFHVLFGFDDFPPQQMTAATLIDTDIDGKVNAAFVATADGGNATVELYTCDDTLTDGCGNAVRTKIYPPSSFCLGGGAGPWNQDAMLEATLPFQDLDLDRSGVVLTALVSYAATSLLTSPKDAIFGSVDQDYGGRIRYDATTGTAYSTGPPGPHILIRRAGNPAAVRAATPHASVTRAPFDDDPGTLGDGQIYFYVAEREGGVPLLLSATPNVAADAVRIGFDDGDPLSAPVDAFLSTLSVDTSSLPADGTSVATVTVVPRGSDGTPLGAGCAVGADPVALSPGVLVGPPADNLDGSYTLRIASSGAGTGDVVVTVEGVALGSRPQIQYTIP